MPSLYFSLCGINKAIRFTGVFTHFSSLLTFIPSVFIQIHVKSHCALWAPGRMDRCLPTASCGYCQCGKHHKASALELAGGVLNRFLG